MTLYMYLLRQQLFVMFTLSVCANLEILSSIIEVEAQYI
jgi:hypothetical protein